MAYYKFRKSDLLKELEQVPDNAFIMINMGGHCENNYPITNIEDSTSCGFYELRCDTSIDFWDALEEAKENNEL